MSEYLIRSSLLSGKIAPPPSKSHTHRALLFGMLGQGKTTIHHPLLSSDTEAMIQALSLFGTKMEQDGTDLIVHGQLRPAADVIDAKNSGIVFRFLSAVSALLPSYTVITGDHSIRSRRPITPLLSALNELGAFATSTRGDGYAPVIIRGPLRPGICSLDGADSQPVSALLIATSFLDGPSEISVTNPGEKPWIDLTLRWLSRLGAKITHTNYTHYTVPGGLAYSGFEETVPADFSSAAFPICAALVTNSSLRVTGLDKEDPQGDKQLIDQLIAMGANIRWEGSDLVIAPSPNLRGGKIDVNEMIDALPILAVVACHAKGDTLLYNGIIARKKESDRIAAIRQELVKMGAQIEEKEDGLLIHPSPLSGAAVSSHSDHRIALALCVAGLAAKGETVVEGIECTAKTYPSFAKDMKTIGAAIESNPLRV